MSNVISKGLTKAAALIRKNGWYQTDYTESEGRLCTLAAINVVFGVENEYGDTDVCSPSETAADFAGDIVEKVINVRRGKLANWNDKKGRTKKEVLAALTKAAKVAKSVGL